MFTRSNEVEFVVIEDESLADVGGGVAGNTQ